MSGSAFSAIVKWNAKLPFGDCVKPKIARQSCRSRCSDTMWLANSWCSTSYVVCHDAAHFCVRLKLMLLLIDVVGGMLYAGPPAIVD